MMVVQQQRLCKVKAGVGWRDHGSTICGTFCALRFSWRPRMKTKGSSLATPPIRSVQEREQICLA